MNETLNILHIIPTFYPATYYGGPIHSVYGLCNSLSEDNRVKLTVLTTDSAGPRCRDRVDVRTANCTTGRYTVLYERKAGIGQFAPGLLWRLAPMIRRADIVHLTSVYSFPTIPTLFLARLFKKSLVWSPRGALQRWEGSRRKFAKRIWEATCNFLLDKDRCVLHVTSKEEAEESHTKIRCAGVAVIQNGVDIPEESPQREWRPDGRLRLLFIGRLDPKKGIENLLAALRVLPPTVTLTICGGGESAYTEELRRLASDPALTGRVRFAGHVSGDKKTRVFRETDVCVVPSYTENFAMVVAEALAHGVPVIASRGTPWADVETRGCGFWVNNDPDSLADSINRISHLDLGAMGARGREWMKCEFSWEAVAGKMLELYTRLAAQSCV